MKELPWGLLVSPSKQKTVIKTCLIPQIAEPLSGTHILKRHNSIVNIYSWVGGGRVIKILDITTVWTTKRSQYMNRYRAHKGGGEMIRRS